MNINTDISSAKTRDYLRKNSEAMQRQMEQLSSGKRINRAADDAAGSAVSEKLQSRIKGLDKAFQNIMDGASMIQVADQSASTISSVVQRMRELAIQASNGTYSPSDRQNLNTEYQQLTDEIDKIANSTEFNGIKVLNSGGVEGVSSQTIQDLTPLVQNWIDDAVQHIAANSPFLMPTTMPKLNVEYYTDSADGTVASVTAGIFPSTGDIANNEMTLKINLSHLIANDQLPADPSGTTLSGNMSFDTVLVHEMTHAFQYMNFQSINQGSFTGEERWFYEGMASAYQGMNNRMNNYVTANGGGATGVSALINSVNTNGGVVYESAYAMMKTLNEVTNGGFDTIVNNVKGGMGLDQAIDAATYSDQSGMTGVPQFSSFSQFVSWFKSDPNVANYIRTNADFNPSSEGAITHGQGNFINQDMQGTVANDAVLDPNFYGKFNVVFKEPETIQLQVGANSGDLLEVKPSNFSLAGLGLKDLDILDSDHAQQAMTALEDALNKINTKRSEFGAFQNRLSFIADNAQSERTNTLSANAQISDADMAKTQSEMVRNKILTQSSIAMLKEGSANLQNVLQLLQ